MFDKIVKVESLNNTIEEYIEKNGMTTEEIIYIENILQNNKWPTDSVSNANVRNLNLNFGSESAC